MTSVTYEKHDVLLIVMDSVRADAVTSETMPSLTGRVAENWISYESAYANSSWSLPSHASMFTGRLPRDHGATARHKYLREGVPTLPEQFGREGYDTTLLSNNAFLSDAFGMTRGFGTVVLDFESKLFPDETDLWMSQRLDRADSTVEAATELLRDLSPVAAVNLLYKYTKRVVPQLASDDDGAQRTVDTFFDLTGSSTPEFTVLNFMEPHLPYTPPDDFWPSEVTVDMKQEFPTQTWEFLLGQTELPFESLRALYEAEIRYLDSKLEELFTRLELSGRLDDAIIVVCGDHGDHFGEHDRQGHVASVHEELTRVPMFVRFPSGELGGRSVDGPVGLRRLFSSLLSWTDTGVPDGQAIGCPLPTEDGNPSEPGVVAEYAGVQYIDAPSEIYDRFDTRMTAVARPGEYLTHEGELASAFDGAVGDVYNTQTQGSTDRISREREQRKLTDAAKDRLEAIGYVG